MSIVECQLNEVPLHRLSERQGQAAMVELVDTRDLKSLDQ